MFELKLVGVIPVGLDLKSVQRMAKILVTLQLDWLQDGVVNLKLVDDGAIQALNKSYSGNDYATDVLSFSYIEPVVKSQKSKVKGQMLELEPRELGDMIISLETAERQANEAGTAISDELATLALHGIMHIHGFDHAQETERFAMDELQADILGQAGVTYRNFNWV